MSNYSIENHLLELSADLAQLKVFTKSPKAIVNTFDLTTAHRVKTESGDFVITATTMPSGFLQKFKVADGDSFSFTDADGIGISDLRTVKVRAQLTYHLGACPIVMQFADAELTVQCPCTGSPCTAPQSECCTIVEQ